MRMIAFHCIVSPGFQSNLLPKGADLQRGVVARCSRPSAAEAAPFQSKIQNLSFSALCKAVDENRTPNLIALDFGIFADYQHLHYFVLIVEPELPGSRFAFQFQFEQVLRSALQNHLFAPEEFRG